jgi:hypothetical protein
MGRYGCSGLFSNGFPRLRSYLLFFGGLRFQSSAVFDAQDSRFLRTFPVGFQSRFVILDETGGMSVQMGVVE